MHLRIPINPQDAAYEVLGDTMVVFKKGDEERWLFRSRNDRLFLTNSSGQEFEFRRATAFFSEIRSVEEPDAADLGPAWSPDGTLRGTGRGPSGSWVGHGR